VATVKIGDTKKCLLILFVIVIFCIVNNYIIIKQDTRPLAGDSAGYFSSSLDYYDYIPFIFRDLRISDITKHVSFFLGYNTEPPLFIWVSMPFYYFFGVGPDVAVMVNSLFLIILIFSVYGIGKYFYNRKVGVLAAFITATMPGIFAMSRIYMLDFALAAMTTLSFYTLLLSDSFKNRKYSILFGITIGFSFLTKISFAIFFFPILLYGLLEIKTYHLKQMRNMIISGIIIIMIVSPWYILNGEQGLRVLWNNVIKPPSNILDNAPNWIDSVSSYQSYFIPQWLTNMLISLVKFSISPFYTLIFLLAMGYFFFYKKNKKDLMLLSWIFIPCISWLVIVMRREWFVVIHRYILPSLPPLAILISAFLLTSKIKRFMPWFLIGIIVAAGLLQYMVFSYSMYFNIPFPEEAQCGIYSAEQENWRLDEVTANMKLIKKDKMPTILFISPNYLSLTMDYMLKLYGKQSNVMNPILCGTAGYTICAYNKGIVLETDYIILDDKTYWLDGDAAQVHAEFYKTFVENMDKFKLYDKLPLPDNSTLYIYERI
jgi:4-amino-4-deoxy-L-arabinose transferase-like glycosyltransferase